MTVQSIHPAVTALDTSQVKNVGIGAIIVIVLVGLLIARLVTKIVTRLVVLVVVVVLAVVVYQQRDRVSAAARNDAKQCHATFFGIHVDPTSAAVKQACARVSR